MKPSCPLLFLIFVCASFRVQAAQAIVNNDGSEAYAVDSGELLHLDLKQSSSAKLLFEQTESGQVLELIGFAPTGEVLGFNDINVWAYNPKTHSIRQLFTVPKGQKIRYAAIKFPSDTLLVSLSPYDYVDNSQSELSFSVRDLVVLNWDGSEIVKKQVKTRREVLPIGTVFDSDGSLFFPMRDAFQCEMDKDYEISGGRCIPVSTEVVFTGGASPSTVGAVSIAASEKMIYVYASRLGGSGFNSLVRFSKPQPARTKLNKWEDFTKIMALYSTALSSMEMLQENFHRGVLCASPNGKHVLMQADEQWFTIDEDGKPNAIVLK